MIVDVQRVGPVDRHADAHAAGRHPDGCAYASHGDTKHILLFPANPAECFTFAVKAFDLAERFQTPVFMLSDLDIGMNDWVVPAPHVGRLLPPEPRPRADRRPSSRRWPKFHRYSPEDENLVAARTLPGVHAKGAFFTRGSGHNKFGGYTEIPDEYQEVMDRLLRKHQAAAQGRPRARSSARRRTRTFGIITLGGCDPAVREALDVLAERGIAADYMRVRGFPFGETVETFLAAHDRVFVVEQNRDAQLRSLLTLETGVPKEKLRSRPGLRRLPAVAAATSSTASPSQL